MKMYVFLLVTGLAPLTLLAQSTLVGGRCEGCEAIFEYGDKVLNNIDTLPEFDSGAPKMLVTGTVFQRDGETPARDIVLYIYHTNQKGVYPTKGNEQGWARRHGYIRGWVKTDKHGRYRFYTTKPASYPTGRIAAHVHITVKEPDKNEYWLDAYEFDDDPYLTQAARNRSENRGGSGIIKLGNRDDILLCQRDIVLGLNVPNYR